ncbi:MAG: hypothetical protein AB1416_00560 [Actinomycetota bacterium]
MSERFLHLGLGRYVRADLVVAVQRIVGEDRGPGRRTLVWLTGVAEPLVASRSEVALLGDLRTLAEEETRTARRVRRTADGGERPRRRRDDGGEGDQDALF